MKEQIESLVGPVDRLTTVERGYTHNERAVVVLSDGSSVFAKRAVDEMTAEWLRREHQMYQLLAGKHLAPELVGWVDGELPMLVLEDLSEAVWPPPWNSMQVDAVRLALSEVASVDPPEDLPIFVDGEQAHEGWNFVLAGPGDFLDLGLCDARWLDRFGHVLQAASRAAPLAGNSLLHHDVRSDNLCIHRDAALLFDWNLACIGNPQFDIAFWVPSLAAESGLPPEELMPNCPPQLAAYIAGFFASHAGQPVIPHAPLVRQAQFQQLQIALPWAARLLGIELA